MTAELWFKTPCEHGSTVSHCPHNSGVQTCCDPDSGGCDGGPWVRLDPDKVVFTIPNDMWGSDDEYTVQDVIDELEEE